MKVLKFLIESIYWLNIFISPVGIIGGVGLVLYLNYNTTWSLILFIVLGAIGIGLGFYWAEWARRTMGCSVYVSRIFNTSHNDQAIDTDNKEQ